MVISCNFTIVKKTSKDADRPLEKMKFDGKICFDHALRRQPLLGSDFWDFSRMHILGLFRLKMVLSRVQKFKESIASGLSRFGASLRELWEKYIYWVCGTCVSCRILNPYLYFQPLVV